MTQISYYQTRVQFEHIDLGGIVYHPQYLSLIEQARSAQLREAGFAYKKLLSLKMGVVIAKAELKYIRSLYLDDILHIYTQVKSIKSGFLTLLQVISTQPIEFEASLADECKKHPSVAFYGELKMACMNLETQSIQNFPEDFIQALG